ncbi:MAG: hypothetical protein HY925_03980 [Elusimicrobia bacterium]|nr:hypothetical protein [Elusimicrobiota bacterium]
MAPNSRFILEARLLGPHQGDPEVEPGRLAPATFGSSGTTASHRAPDPDSQTGGPILNVKLGMKVFHPEFGTGRIKEKSGAGEQLKVTVEFESGKVKKLLVRYARLEPA